MNDAKMTKHAKNADRRTSTAIVQIDRKKNKKWPNTYRIGC